MVRVGELGLASDFSSVLVDVLTSLSTVVFGHDVSIYIVGQMWKEGSRRWEPRWRGGGSWP